MTELRLLSWNVRSLRDGREAVAAVIREAGVDVALIQEAPRFARWRSKRAALAREAGLLVGTADRVGGLLVLTSMRSWISAHDHQVLPRLGGRHRRALVTATVSVAGEPAWRVAVTHLGLHPAEREAHASQVNAALARPAEPGPPVVVGADVNDGPESSAWRSLSDGLADAMAAGGATGATYPSSAPRRRIDGIFVSPDVQVVAARVLDLPRTGAPSDHLPLLVHLRRP